MNTPRIVIILVTSTLASTAVSFADCTRDEAFNKMMKVNQVNVSLQAEMPN